MIYLLIDRDSRYARDSDEESTLHDRRPPPADTCYAYLLRHGSTDANLAHPPILQGRSIDGPLSAEGRQQASAAASSLSTEPIDAVYCSPLLRARETAEFIALPHGLTARIVDAITEVNVGAWERRSWEEIARSEPEAYHAFQHDPAVNGYRGGENLQQVFARVSTAVNELMKQHLGQTIAIVGHNVVNRVLLAAAFHLPLARARSIVQYNGGINLLHYRRDTTAVVMLNSCLHLEQRL